MKILNFGSLNIDYTYHVDHFVKPGETESSFSRSINIGGKGLNQSIALARAGASVYQAGAVGSQDGAILLDALKKNGINCDHVRSLLTCGSGNAFIQVNPDGENCIVLYGGANQAMTHDFIDDVLSHFDSGDWIVMQNEISEMPYLIEKAHARGMYTILNPSPMNEKVLAMPLDDIDLFLVNKEEAQALAGSSDDVLKKLANKFPSAKIVMTLGSHGVQYFNGSEVLKHGCYQVDAVDTTGAGDTFTGFFIASVAKGISEGEALRIASRASAIAVTRQGASQSIPTMEEVINTPLSLKD